MSIELAGLDHVVLRTAHREQMLSFYIDVLGARLERTIESIGLYQLRAGASLIDLFDVVDRNDVGVRELSDGAQKLASAAENELTKVCSTEVR